MYKECPKCGKLNNDNWPVKVGHDILLGGCQMCWESESADSWWHTIALLQPEKPEDRG